MSNHHFMHFKYLTVLFSYVSITLGFPCGLVVKNPPANAGDSREAGSIPGLGRSPGGGCSNLLQYSCLENSMDRGAWWATVHRVAKSQTQLKWLSTYARVKRLWKKSQSVMI